MSVASPVYFEIIDFISARTTPEAVAHFRPSPEAQQRVAALIEGEEADHRSPEEKAELDHFVGLEHILRMAKARARQISSLAASLVSLDKNGWADIKPFLQQHPEINYTVAVPHPTPRFQLVTIVDLKPLGNIAALRVTQIRPMMVT